MPHMYMCTLINHLTSEILHNKCQPFELEFVAYDGSVRWPETSSHILQSLVIKLNFLKAKTFTQKIKIQSLFIWCWSSKIANHMMYEYD